MAAAAEERKSCGLACPSDVESAAPRPQWLDIGYGVKVMVSGRGLNVEIVDGVKRLSSYIDASSVELLFRYMLDKLDETLLGSTAPSMTALYALKTLRDMAGQWLRAVEERRRELEKRLRDAEEKAKNYLELKREADEAFKRYQELLRRLDEECGEDTACRAEMSRKLGVEKAWEEYNELARKMDSLKICGYGHSCYEPARYAKHLKQKLAEAEETEKRLRIAALALSHTWRALTHPTIDDLEQLYVIPSSGDGSGPLDQFMQKAAKAGVA